MERIQALIDKLYEQRQQGNNAAQLLLTVELLRNEILKLQQRNGTLGTAKVAVTLPVNMNFVEEEVRNFDAVTSTPEPQSAQPAVNNDNTDNNYALRKPAPVTEPIPVAEPVSSVQERINPAFNLVEETPLVKTQESRKELHEVIAEKKESLNDLLRQEKKELVHALKETPIKDLRKGIGINDRFTFINELFKGDEAMYERSIKTINSFNIFSEAEYWMNRELKFKLGWSDDNEVAVHFYHLVRRRFS